MLLDKQAHFELPGNGTAIRLFQEDCVGGLRERLAPRSVDVVVTSPPYNLGIDYAGYDDRAPREAYLAWVEEWLALVAERLAEDGSFFLNIGSKPSDPWVPYEVLAVARRHFQLQNVIHWVKSIAIHQAAVGKYPGITGDVVVGHYKPINSPRFLNDCHEYLFHLTLTGKVPLDRLAIGVPYQDTSNVERWQRAGNGVHCRGNTWFIPYPTIQRRDRERPHPATFPPQLPAMCLRLHGLDRVRLAVDPFLGIGSTALACAELGVNFTGFEIAAEYFQVASQRVSEAVGHAGAASPPLKRRTTQAKP